MTTQDAAAPVATSALAVDDPDVDVKDIIDLDQFKARVVAVARDEARKRDWCEVVDSILVDRLGLGAYYPNLVVIQYKPDATADWAIYESRGDDSEALRERATSSVKSMWSQALMYNKNPEGPFNHRFHVDADTDLEEMFAKVKQRQAQIGVTKTPATIFPRYRLVVVDRANDQVLGIIWSCEDHLDDVPDELKDAIAPA